MTEARAELVHAKPAEECAFDMAALGEIMLRLDPRDRRIRTTRTFDVWDTGAEYNVARAFRRTFGLRGVLLTAFARNEVGYLLEDIVLSAGLDMSYVHWRDYDGIGRNVRNGLNFSERGFGVRGAVGCVDRANTAIAQMRPDDIDLEDLFVRKGVRWLHTGGIMAGLSDQAAETTLAVIKAARASGTVVSYDLNYRPSLWKAQGGIGRCREVNREMAKYVDVMIGNEEDFTVCLGLEVDGLDTELSALDSDAYRRMITSAADEYPNFRVVATTLRQVRTATRNDWSAIAWARGRGFAEATPRHGLEIYDRLGGGDSFASGLAYGLLELDDLQLAVEYGAANGAIAMTTPGDTTTASLAEIRHLVGGGSMRVQR